MGYIILFFIAGPVIIGVGNLIIGSLVYLILATICYFLFLQGKLQGYLQSELI